MTVHQDDSFFSNQTLKNLDKKSCVTLLNCNTFGCLINDVYKLKNWRSQIQVYWNEQLLKTVLRIVDSETANWQNIERKIHLTFIDWMKFV